MPALLAAGLSPAQALATNKLQSVGGSFSASLYFIRRKAVDLREQKLNIALTFSRLHQRGAAGSARQGRYSASAVTAAGDRYRPLFFADAKDWRRRSPASPAWPAFCAGGGGCVGFYDGFFGPGAGSFYALAFVTLCGYNLAKSTAHAKVLNFTSNLGGLLLFMLGGKVVWLVGLVMLAGQVCGARLGARMVLTKGQKLIRPMIVIVSAVMSAKLLYDSHGAEIAAWLHQL